MIREIRKKAVAIGIAYVKSLAFLLECLKIFHKKNYQNISRYCYIDIQDLLC